MFPRIKTYMCFDSLSGNEEESQNSATVYQELIEIDAANVDQVSMLNERWTWTKVGTPTRFQESDSSKLHM